MNLDRWQGLWKQARGRATQFLGRLFNDRLLVFVGEQDAFNGRIQERVGRMHASRGRYPGAIARAFAK